MRASEIVQYVLPFFGALVAIGVWIFERER